MTGRRRIILLGCGWLGSALALALKEQGYAPLALVRSPESLKQLQGQGIETLLWDISQAPPKALEAERGQLVFLSIPPSGLADYALRAQEALDFLAPEKLLYTSSTGVYGSAAGPWTEQSETLPQRGSAQAVLALEKSLQQSAFPSLVLRLAGLIGPGRMPGRFFAAKQNLPGQHWPVNLIRRDDIVELVLRFLGTEETGIWNICSDKHPPRAEYYSSAAQALGLELPSFDTSDTGQRPVVDVTKLLKRFPDFCFRDIEAFEDFF